MSRRRSNSRFESPSDNELKTIITDPDGTQVLVEWADTLGEALKSQRLTTSQIRALFGEVRQIQGEWSINRPRALRRLILLKPKMAYRARRERGRAVQALVDVLDPALDWVVKAPERPEGTPPGTANNQDDNFQRFVDFFEAILAYHKAHGGY